MMIPQEASILPNYRVISKLRWIDSYLGLIVPSIASGFGIFLMRQSFLQTPIDLLDAAKLDGAGHLLTLRHVVLPLSRPIMITFGLFSFLWKWNAYLWPLIVTNSERMRTLPIGLAMLRVQEGMTEWNVLMAGTVFVLMPVIIVFIFAQRYIIEGVAHTGLKG
jgi:ABC-type glycerol-3-phosphate transport system permease component